MSTTSTGYYRVGVADVSVTGAPADLTADFKRLHRGYRQASSPGAWPIEMEVVATRTRWGRQRFAVLGAGQALGRPHCRSEVLPYLEWGVNWTVIRSCLHFAQFHAATLVRDRRAVIIAGNSGAGKSTLAAGLLARGWHYATDELTLVDPDTLRVHPYPKPICIKQGAFDVVRRDGLPLWAPGRFVKALKGEVGYINPHDVGPGALADVSTIDAVVFPKYTGRRTPDIGVVSPGRAAVGLLGCMLNRNAYGDRAVRLVGRIVRASVCLRLESGELGAACALLDHALRPRRSTCSLPHVRNTYTRHSDPQPCVAQQ